MSKGFSLSSSIRKVSAKPTKSHKANALLNAKKPDRLLQALNAETIRDETNPRTRILKIASILFSTYGFAGTTMADVADAAGIRSPSLYYHFADKAEIIKDLANIALEIAFDVNRSVELYKDRPVPDRLFYLVKHLVLDLYRADYDLYCMFDPVFYQEDFDDLNVKLRAWLGQLASLIAEGSADGSLAEHDPKVATRTVRGVVQSALRSSGGYSSLTHEQAAHHVATFAVRGLLPGPIYQD